MEYEVIGWPEDGPTLDLDWQEFSYAGKFVMTNTGKAVLRDRDQVIAAVAFNADRTDPDTAWLRYVTVMKDLRREGLGSRLAAFTTDELLDDRFQTVKIAVNNPFAYEALYKAGFEYTGSKTGIAELVLETGRGLDGGDGDPEPAAYRSGLEEFADRDLSEAESQFVSRKLDRGVPPTPHKDIR